jgi:hypothetical protein
MTQQRFRVRFFKNLEDSTGHTHQCVQGGRSRTEAHFGQGIGPISRLCGYFPNLTGVDGCRDIVIAISNKLPRAMRDSVSPQS